MRQRALLLLLPMLLAACSRTEPAPEPVRAVRTLVASRGDAAGTREFAAEVRARTESRLGFRVGGKMVRRQAEVGQHVRAGQLLAELDPEDLRLAQSAAIAGAQAAQVNLDLAGADFKRFQGLRDQGFISAAELERRETTLKAAQAQWEQLRAQAGMQRNQAGYAALTAGVPGVVTAVEAEPGAVLTAGTPVLRLAHDGARDVVFAVPESTVGTFRDLLGKPGVLLVRPWGASAALPAGVREVAAAADAVTRTFQVKADVGNASALQLGQTASVLLREPPRAGVVRLPLSALTEQHGQAAVWLVDEPAMTVRLQPVTVAGADGNTVLVASGVAPGARVVTAGVHVLTPGQKVKLYAGP